MPSANIKIKSELMQKGLKKELIDKLVTKSVNSDSNSDLVMQTALAKAKNLKDPDPIRFKRRLTSFLLRKGFEWEEVLRVVDTLVKRQYNKAELDKN